MRITGDMLKVSKAKELLTEKISELAEAMDKEYFFHHFYNIQECELLILKEIIDKYLDLAANDIRFVKKDSEKN